MELRLPPSSIFVAAALVAACSSSSSGRNPSDGGPGGTGGSGTTIDSGGAHCELTTLAVAPDECLDADWAHAIQTYPRGCRATLGGYRASCGSFDTIIVEGRDAETWCFYSRKTGTLAGSERTTSAGTRCLSFDLGFAAPDTSSCTPASGVDCADGG